MRLRAITVADLPALEALCLRTDIDAQPLGRLGPVGIVAAVYAHLTRPHLQRVQMVALAAVLGARIAGGTFTGGKIKGVAVGSIVPGELGTGKVAHLELLTVDPQCRTYRKRLTAAILTDAWMQCATQPGVVRLVGLTLSPTLPAVASGPC